MPTVIEWGEISLDGKIYVIDSASGPFRGITRQDSAILDPPITFGDTTYKSHPYLSSWVISDLTGGIGVEDITGADTNRYRWGTADARSPGNIGLGPLITETRPTADNADTLSIVGDVPGTNEELYVAVLESAGLTNLYAWNESTDAWRAASLDIDVAPSSKGVLFQGIGANPFLVIPRGTTAAIGVRTTAAGTLATSAVGLVAASHLAVWSGRLWQARETSQILDYTFDVAAAATTVTDARTGGNLILDPAQNLLALFSWWNLAGEQSLFALTTRSLWVFNDLSELWEHVYDLPPHPCLFRPAAIWKPTEDLWLGAGGTIIRRTPSGVSVELAGPGADADGLPSGFIGQVHFLESAFGGLYCILDAADSTQKSSLLVYNGLGWFPLWEAPSAGRDSTSWDVVSQASDEYRLWWAFLSYAYTMQLNRAPHSPRQSFILGTDKFAASSYLETGRFWAQTHGQNKLAVIADVYMENATADETLTIKYQTDTVTSWTTLGSAIVTGRNNGTYRTSIRFGTANADGVNPGIAFNWIRFRLEFVRGATTTLTPILNALVLHFLKIRDNTPAFQIALTFPDVMPDGRTGDEAKADLVTLVEANALVTLRYGSNIHAVWVAGLSGPDSSGSDNRGARTLSLISLQEVS